MASRYFQMLWHGASLAVMSWGYSNLKSMPADEWIRTQRGGHWQFLTVQALAISWFTMAVSLRHDISPSRTWLKSVKRVLAMVSIPLSTIVSILYWSLLSIDPALILPAETASSSDVPFVNPIPRTLDLALHASPALTLVIDFLVFESKYPWPQAMRRGTVLAAIFGLWYALWAEWCAAGNGRYPYPFLETSLGPRIAIYVASTFLAQVIFWLLNALHPQPSPTLPAQPTAEVEGGAFGDARWVWFHRISL